MSQTNDETPQEHTDENLAAASGVSNAEAAPAVPASQPAPEDGAESAASPLAEETEVLPPASVTGGMAAVGADTAPADAVDTTVLAGPSSSQEGQIPPVPPVPPVPPIPAAPAGSRRPGVGRWIGRNKKRIAASAVATALAAALFGGGFALGHSLGHGPGGMGGFDRGQMAASRQMGPQGAEGGFGPQMPGQSGTQMPGQSDTQANQGDTSTNNGTQNGNSRRLRKSQTTEESATPSDIRGAEAGPELEEGNLSSGGGAATSSVS